MATTRCLLALTAAVLLAGLVPGAAAGSVTCKPGLLEVVFAVDVSQSLTQEHFAELQTFLQEMAEHLPLGPDQTRPAVISFSTDAKVEINLGAANDLQSFKRAITAIPRSGGFTATGLAMQAARRTVFPRSRPGASQLLVVVTDGRANLPGSVAEANALVRSESAELRSEGIRIHAIGIGDIRLREELEAIAGSDDFSMINDFKGLKALVDTLVKDICSVRCDEAGTESFPGQCFSGTQRVVHVAKEFNKALSRCEKSITYEYKYCGTSHLCKEVDVTVGDCVKGVREVVTTWEDFNVKLQKCVLRRSVQQAECKDTAECTESMAEILFLLDSSGSIDDKDWRLQVNFVHRLVENMRVGPGAVRIGVIVFDTNVWNDIPLGSVTDKPALLRRIQGLARHTEPWTNTGEAIRLARSELDRLSRPGVSRTIVLMTDGESTTGPNAIREAAKLESDGVTSIVIGVGTDLKKEELQGIATPPLADHLFYAADFDRLLDWAGQISNGACDSIAPVDPSLCWLPPKRVVSSCYNSLQKVTEIRYEHDAQGKCTRKVVSHTSSPCKVICTDPINGNQYYEGETWKTDCATFVCRRPDTQTSVFRPVARDCPGTDYKCYDRNASENFSCRDNTGQLFHQCNCLAQSGNPLLRVITADASAKP